MYLSSLNEAVLKTTVIPSSKAVKSVLSFFYINKISFEDMISLFIFAFPETKTVTSSANL